MADEPEEMLLDDPIAPEGDDGDPQPPVAEPEGDDDEIEIEIEGEEPEDDPAQLPGKLRAIIRERDRELAEYRRQNVPQPVEVGEKPTLESCEYDEEKFEAALDGWKERKRQADKQASDAEQRQEVANREAQRNLTKYQQKKVGLPADKMQAAEDTVLATLTPFAQSAILEVADDPARVVYALGAHPAKLEQLRQLAETSPAQFIKQVTLLERNLKVTNKRAAPAPEGDTILRGSAPLSAPKADAQAEKLLEKGAKSGNMTEYNRYMKAKRQAAK